LKRLNQWLQARGLEIPFQSEIGEATVGSLATADSKESSLDGPGYSRPTSSRSPTSTTKDN
jgi:hypothetical protein